MDAFPVLVGGSLVAFIVVAAGASIWHLNHRAWIKAFTFREAVIKRCDDSASSYTNHGTAQIAPGRRPIKAGNVRLVAQMTLS